MFPFDPVGRLDGATNMWMDGGKWVGTMTDLIWDEDGEMFRLNPRTAVWTPPDPLRRSHRRARTAAFAPTSECPVRQYERCCRLPCAGLRQPQVGSMCGLNAVHIAYEHLSLTFD